MTSSPEVLKPESFSESGEITIIRSPVKASMSDGAILRGFCYEREEDGSSQRRKNSHSPAPLLCVPDELGNTNEHHEFALKLAALPQSPKRIYTLDLRGRGLSDSTNVADSSTLSDADDLISICDAIGLHDVDILVNGRSALTVLLTAPKRPGLIRKLIFNDAGVEFDAVGIARQTALRQRTKAPSNWSEAIDQLKELHGEHFPTLDEDDWATFAKSMWQDIDGKPVAYIAKGLTRLSNAVDYDSKQPDLWAELQILKTRMILLIRGEHSPLMTRDISQKLQSAHGAMEEVVAAGQGHVPLLHKGDLTNQISEFLSAQ